MTDGVRQRSRIIFWAVDRDRSCPAGTTAGDTCNGIVQADHRYSTLTAGFTG